MLVLLHASPLQTLTPLNISIATLKKLGHKRRTENKNFQSIAAEAIAARRSKICCLKAEIKKAEIKNLETEIIDIEADMVN